MERRQQMDTPGIASTRRQRKIDRIYGIVQNFIESISILKTRLECRIQAAGGKCNQFGHLGRLPPECGTPNAFPIRLREITLLLILAFSAIPLRAQPALSDRATEIKQLFAEERWDEIVRSAEVEVERSADLNYYYGAALAHLGRWDEAKR